MHVERAVARDRRGDHVDERGAVFVVHLTPAGQVVRQLGERRVRVLVRLLPGRCGPARSLAELEPGCLVEVHGVAQCALVVDREVDDRVGSRLLRGHLLASVLGPERQVNARSGQEGRDVCLARGLAQVALVVTREVERLVLCSHRGGDLLGVAVALPAVDGRLLEPADVVEIGGGGAVLRPVLGVRGDGGLVDNGVLANLRPPLRIDVGSPVAVVVQLSGHLDVDVTRCGVAAGVVRGEVRPRAPIGVAALDGHEGGVVRDVPVRPAVDVYVDRPLGVGLAAAKEGGRDATSTPDDVDDDVRDGVPAGALHPVARDRVAADRCGAAADEVVAQDVLVLDSVVGPLRTGAEAVLGVLPGVLVDLVRLLGLPRVLPGVLVLPVGLLGLPRDEARVLPLVVGDLDVAGDGVLELGQLG